MDKLKMHSVDKVQEHIAQIGKLFPNCITERKVDGKVVPAVDFDMLRQELSDVVVEGPAERYQFTWPDKRKSVLAANAPIAATLRPVRNDETVPTGRDSEGKPYCSSGSVNFDTTENLYIEGDNLEVLKLLQETYLGKVKMIYIDPPYNTGNDFVYQDDFSQNSTEYRENSGQFDDAGNQMVRNLESNGRFHTDWLNMIYCRLKLAKDLLSEDGLIFISIDENEICNLRKCCEDVFGAQNLIGQITLLCNPKGRSQDKYIANCHEYVLIFSRNQLPSGSVSIPKTLSEISKDYPLQDKEGNSYRELELRNTHREFGRNNRPNLWYPLYVLSDGSVSVTKDGSIAEVYPLWEDGFEGCWTWGIQKTVQQRHLLTAKRISGNWKIFRKAYAFEDNQVPLKQVKSIWNDNQFHTEKGQIAFSSLFDAKSKLFQAPKSIYMLMQCIKMCQNKNAFVLDFFSGSATTAHAVMQLNAEDGGHRKFIMIQLPEKTDEKSEAYKASYKNICEIGKERIRRAGTKIKNESPLTTSDLDVGFRVLKLDSSNMKDVYYQPDEYEINFIEELAGNIKEDRTPEDLLFQVMLDLGVLLSSKIEETVIAGKKVFNVAEGYLIACFDSDISNEVVTAIAKMHPSYAVFRDSGFRNDSTAANFEQIFTSISPNTERKVL